MKAKKDLRGNMINIGKQRALGIANREYEDLIYQISLSEDNKMTLLETASTLSGTIPPNVRTKDVLLVENLKKAYEYTLYKVEKDDFYFDKDTLNMINRLSASQDNFDNLGDFRKGNIRVLGTQDYSPLDSSELNFHFVQLQDKYLENENKDIAIIDLFLDLCKAQFYGDGNKRTAQIMMIGLLIKEGYSPFTINFRYPKYSKPLINFYDNEKNREKIINLLLKRQEEVLYHYLNNEERKKYKINITKDQGKQR